MSRLSEKGSVPVEIFQATTPVLFITIASRNASGVDHGLQVHAVRHMLLQVEDHWTLLP